MSTRLGAGTASGCGANTQFPHAPGAPLPSPPLLAACFSKINEHCPLETAG